MERDPGEAGQETWVCVFCLSFWSELVVVSFGVSIVFRNYFALANVCISLPSQKPAFVQSTPLHPPWLPFLEIYRAIYHIYQY